MRCIERALLLGQTWRQDMHVCLYFIFKALFKLNKISVFKDAKLNSIMTNSSLNAVNNFYFLNSSFLNLIKKIKKKENKKSNGVMCSDQPGECDSNKGLSCSGSTLKTCS